MTKHVTPGTNDLFTLNPTAKEMWDFDKNEVDPMTLTKRSAATVWWKCSKGHSFQRSVSAFFLHSTCPICKKEAQSILNYPHVMKYWDCEKNLEDPANINRNYKQPVNWKCPDCGYEWKSLIRSRTDKCPLCDVDRPGRIVPGHNDVLTLAPILASEFIEDKNPGISLSNLGVADKKVQIFWKCRKCGYEWRSTIFARLRECLPGCTNQCPVCGKAKRAISFEEEFPELLERWSPSNGFPLSEVTGNDWHTEYIWRCPEHGDFRCSLSSMIRAIPTKSHGCPYCAGKKVLPEESLSSTYPELISEWSYAENCLICNPEAVSPTYSATVWWICPNCRLKYTQKISEHTTDHIRGLESCPYCTKVGIHPKTHII